MQAITLSRHGGPKELLLTEVAKPEVEPGKVLLRMHAAALNHLDLFVRQGWPGLRLNFPHILGSDGCGEIIAMHDKSDVNGMRMGDLVIVNPTLGCQKCEFCRQGDDNLCVKFRLLGEQVDGTYAEYLQVPEENIYPLPQHLSAKEGAALPLTFVTAWRMLDSLAAIKPEETVLIQGIGGGVATAALILAVAKGCRVLVSSRDEEKLAQAIELGAERGFLCNPESLASEIRTHTNKRGVDVVVDSVGDATWRASLAALRRGGRLVTCGATSGAHPKTDIQRIFWNHLTIFGSTMGNREEFAAMYDFVVAKKLRPKLDKVYTYQKFDEAFERLESAKQMGKIVLRMTEEVNEHA